MDTARDDTTADLLHRLVKSVVLKSTRHPLQPSNEARALKTVQRVYNYAVRIVGSRIAPRVVGDEQSVAEAMKRFLAQNGKHTEALAFAELHQKLQEHGDILRRYEVLRLMFQLSKDNANKSSNAAGVALLGAAHSGVFPQVERERPGTAPSYTSTPADTPRDTPRTSTDSWRAPETPQSSSHLPPYKVLAYQKFYDIEKTDYDMSEEVLVRDVVYACQGIDGRYVKFRKDPRDPDKDSFVVDKDVGVPNSSRELIHKLCELGWLFRKVQGPIASAASLAITSTSRPQDLAALTLANNGSFAQAFCAALQHELADYYRLMAVLEAQAHAPRPNTGSGAAGGAGAAPYLTLKRLAVWLAEPTQRMRLLAVMVDACAKRKGGALLGALHAYTKHGDPFVRTFSTRITQQVCEPLFSMVRRWLFEGELEDPRAEFFIVADESIRDENLWFSKYRLNPSMLPPFITTDLAETILRTGKSINFMRLCCEDKGWVDASAAAAAAARGGLVYGRGSELESAVAEACLRIDSRLLQLLFRDHKLPEHCLALKRYLLLGQGDFIQSLLDLVGPDLNAPAHKVTAYRLNGALEGAIRASNAQFDDPDVLERLRVVMMPHQPGEQGWDVFTLHYSVQMPLSTIFTQQVMEKYVRVFNHLWHLKRVEYALSASWMVMKPNQLLKMEQNLGPGAGAEMMQTIQRCQTLRYEMNHFVTNLQYYMMFEVLETSWDTFQAEMNAAKDLDQLIAAHHRYLDSILRKALLEEVSSTMLNQLKLIFNVLLKFRGFSGRLHEYAADIASKNAALADASEVRAAGGKWGRTEAEAEAIQLNPMMVHEMTVELQKIAGEYAEHLQIFLSLLPVQKHVDLTYLRFRLDFSEFYMNRVELRSPSSSAQPSPTHQQYH